MAAGNSINESTTGISGFTGTAFVGTPVTQYNILTGSSTSSTLNNVAPSATSGVPVISQGAASQPVFGTAVVAGGGTGQVTLTNHGVLVGAVTAAITQLSAGTAGQILQSGGASADPAYSTSTYPTTNAVNTLLYASNANVMAALATANSAVIATNSSGVPAARLFSIVSQVFTSTGTYTPTTGMLYCIIEAVGGGGGGGGCATTTSAQVSAASSGGAGGYGRKVFSAATIGASQAVTIGAAGAGGTAGANNGNTGGNTTVGALLTANGGVLGVAGAAGLVAVGIGGVGGTATSGDINIQGQSGGNAYAYYNTYGNSMVSAGGSSPFGAGGQSSVTSSGQVAGQAALGNGGGGSGGICGTSGTQQAGGAGTKGIVVVTEYIIN